MTLEEKIITLAFKSSVGEVQLLVLEGLTREKSGAVEQSESLD